MVIGDRLVRIGCFIFLLFFYTRASAQTSICLTDHWEFLRQDLGGGPWEALRPVTKKDDPAIVPLWRPVRLPHCVNAEDAVDPSGNYYRGPAWYRTQLEIHNPYAGGRILLHFEGAGQKTEVYIYTTKVGSHTGGYDEWTVDITDAVAAFEKTDAYQAQYHGKIPLCIRTDNSRDLQMIPSGMSDFNLYGGIYRRLYLKYVPAVYIDQVSIRTEVDSLGRQGMVHIRVLASGTGPYSLELRDPAGKVVWAGTDTDRVVKKPRLWSPDDPALYTVRVTLRTADGDSCVESQHIGFRHFSFKDHGPFFLNGSRLLLRGTHRHEDHAGLGAAMTEDLMRQEMILIKEMGVNFIRLGHYQQSPVILDLCDSLGILVWEEIPWCRGGLGGPVYQQQARDMMTHMIGQHFNHPAVIIWGLGNENDWPGDFPEFDKEKIRQFMKELNDLAHRLDPSRRTAIRRCDFCKDIPDIYSPSIWAGWYRGVYTDYRSISEEESKKVTHFLHVEWGGDSHAGRHAEEPIKNDWSETYMCDLIDWHLKEQEQMPWLTGTAQWCFKDFSTPLRPDNPVPYVNQKGVVERDLTKKEGYYVFQSYWSRQPMVHIYGHSWPVRWGNDGQSRQIKVYSNCDEAELYLNGKSYGVRRRNTQDYPAAGLRWNVSFSPGENVVRVAARKGRIVVEDSIHVEYQTEKWGKPAKMKIDKVHEEDGIVTVRVRLLDQHNIPCLDAADWVSFGLTGDGRLIENMGTSTGSRYVQACNGRAIIRLHTNNGHSIVSARSGVLPTAFLDIASSDSVKAIVEETLRGPALEEAARALQQTPITVTASRCPRSAGGPHDFYSEGDYWWPDPKHPDSPYIQRDGMTNPENFTAHRLAMIRLSRIVGALATAYRLTGDAKYIRPVLEHCKAWFVDSATHMNPNLQYAQAIKGRATGRGIGIIDTIQLMEVVMGLEAMEDDAAMDKGLLDRIRQWFKEYLKWLTTHPYGKDEMNAANNHGTCWVMQVAAFAHFTGDGQLMAFCRRRYKEVLLPGQMDADGSFPRELKRTKPYGYSLFNLDAMATICQLLSTPEDDLWNYQTADGRGIGKGIGFMAPFIADKGKWPYAHDVMFWNEWPVAQPALVFGASALGHGEWLHVWERLDHAPANEEVIRNLPVRHPIIWLNKYYK
ncbi:MAG TPA: alginate lyase family protein [Puia sp.]|nr:alginate lyase family protein [Puia sp.]